MDLNELLNQYKNMTIKIIECLENDKFSDMQLLIEAREDIIDGIKNSEYTQEEFKQLCSNLDLINLEHQLNVLINTKKSSIKEKLDKSIKRSQVNDCYNKMQTGSFIFSKKV